MAVSEKTQRRTPTEIHQDQLTALREREATLTGQLAQAPAELERLRDDELRSKPAGGRTGAVGSEVAEHVRRIDGWEKDLRNTRAEIASRQRLLVEEQTVEQEKQRKSLLRDAQDFAEREGVLLDALGEKAREFYVCFGAYIAEVEAKAYHLAGHSITDSGTAEELRMAFQPVLWPRPLDAAALFDLLAEVGTDGEAQMAGQPVSEVGQHLPDRTLDPAAFEEAVANQALDRLMNNIPRPDLAKAPPVIRARHRVEGLGNVPDLTGLDVRPSDAIPGPRFGKDEKGRPPVVGSQFAGIDADRAWPQPGEGA
jgi:hypothetical protein